MNNYTTAFPIQENPVAHCICYFNVYSRGLEFIQSNVRSQSSSQLGIALPRLACVVQYQAYISEPIDCNSKLFVIHFHDSLFIVTKKLMTIQWIVWTLPRRYHFSLINFML